MPEEAGMWAASVATKAEGGETKGVVAKMIEVGDGCE